MLKDILRIIEKDAKLTTEQIAVMLNVSAKDVKKEIKNAEDAGIILKYKTVINWDKVENEHVFAFIEVRITPQRNVGFDSIAERIYQFPEARSVFLVSGNYDVAVMVRGKTMHQIADFVAQKLSAIDGVCGTATYFILKRYKEDGEILNPEGESKRQPVIL